MVKSEGHWCPNIYGRYGTWEWWFPEGKHFQGYKFESQLTLEIDHEIT